MAQEETRTEENSTEHDISRVEESEIKTREGMTKIGKRSWWRKKYILFVFNFFKWILYGFFRYFKYIVTLIIIIILFPFRNIIFTLIGLSEIFGNANVNHEGRINIEHNIRFESDALYSSFLPPFELKQNWAYPYYRLNRYAKCPELPRKGCKIGSKTYYSAFKVCRALDGEDEESVRFMNIRYGKFYKDAYRVTDYQKHPSSCIGNIEKWTLFPYSLWDAPVIKVGDTWKR